MELGRSPGTIQRSIVRSFRVGVTPTVRSHGAVVAQVKMNVVAEITDPTSIHLQQVVMESHGLLAFVMNPAYTHPQIQVHPGTEQLWVQQTGVQQ
jgi:hypothetical protein